MGMTSHIVFDAWDAERPATLSPAVIADVIRRRIGFDGLLMTDDIDMKALSGTAGEKAAGAIAAGCDLVLDCWARMDEMVDIAGRLGPITPAARARLARATTTTCEQPWNGSTARGCRRSSCGSPAPSGCSGSSAARLRRDGSGWSGHWRRGAIPRPSRGATRC